MTEAQTLEKAAYRAGSRCRDQYDTVTNASRESTIYETVLGGDAEKKRDGGDVVASDLPVLMPILSKRIWVVRRDT